MNGLALCAGIGGLERGVADALRSRGVDYRTVAHVERDAYAASVLVARMEDAALDQAPIWDDVTTFDARPWRGVVDCVTSGIPCQPYSSAGKRKGHADERALWPELVRIVRECEPALVFVENVARFLKHSEGLFNALGDLGFECAPPLLSTAAEYGAPHLRERIWPPSVSVSSLPTPSVSLTTGGQRSRSGDRKSELLLGGIIASLPTPSAVAYGTNQGGAAGRVGEVWPSLDGLVRTLPTPTAQDAKASGAAGYSTASGRHSGTTLTDALAGAASAGRRGRVSPRFVEWMMGLPIGWTDCAASVTPSSPSKRATPSRRSTDGPRPKGKSPKGRVPVTSRK